MLLTSRRDKTKISVAETAGATPGLRSLLSGRLLRNLLAWTLSSSTASALARTPSQKASVTSLPASPGLPSPGGAAAVAPPSCSVMLVWFGLGEGLLLYCPSPQGQR